MPESYLDRSNRPTIRAAQPGTVGTLAVEVVRHERPANSRQPWRIIVKDETGTGAALTYDGPGALKSARRRRARSRDAASAIAS